MPLYLRETNYSGGTNLGTTLNYGQLDGNFIYLDEKFGTGPFTGSLSGSLQGTASYANIASSSLSSSYTVSSSYALSSSYTVSSSYALTASHITTPTFPYTGSAIISGSLTITGSTFVSGNLFLRNQQFTVKGDNIFIGTPASNLNTSGTGTEGRFNVTIGQDALQAVTTGERNMAVGTNALYQNLTGKSNVAIGTNALYSNETGMQNIGIGEAAGYATGGSNRNISGNNNIFIGYYSIGQSSSDTNEIVIGNNTTGSGTNTVTIGNSSVTRTILRNLNVTGSILVSGSIIPNVGSGEFTSSFNLGSATAAWKDLYVSNGTINFLDGTGAVQGTLSSTAAGLALGSSKLSGSFIVTGAIDHSPQTWLGSSAGDQRIPKYTEAFLYSNFPIQNTTAFSIFSGSAAINPVIITAYGFSVLPFYKKHNSYFVQNNGDATTHANFTSSLILSLPPWTNIGLAPGERVTVYNMSSGSNLLNSGSIYIGSTLQYVDSVESYNTNGYTNRVKSTTNNGSLLSGSWLNWKNINPVLYSNTSHSITLNPGEKAIFELVSFPRAMDVLEPGNLYNNFSNSNYPASGSREMDVYGFDALGSTRCAYVFIAKENIS